MLLEKSRSVFLRRWVKTERNTFLFYDSEIIIMVVDNEIMAVESEPPT
jgi:hypothetical protein